MINELIVGGLIHHIMHDRSLPFPSTMLRTNVAIKWENRVNFLIGENSIGEGIVGIGYDIPIALHPTLGSINFKIGAYFQDEHEFEYRNIITPFSCDIVPILGVEVNIPYNDYIGVTTTITPIITFTGIYFRF